MTSTRSPIRLRGARDVLAVLPYQLGYHPSDCLVAVVLRDGGVGMVSRLDLPPADHVEDAVAALLGPILRDDPDAVLLVGYEPPCAAGAARPVMDAMAAALSGHGVEVQERLVVRDGRWFAPDCGQGCCPDEGEPVPDPAEVPAVADFVAMGRSPLTDRAGIEARLLPDPGEDRELVSRAVARRRRGAESTGSAGALLPSALAVWARVLATVDGRSPAAADATWAAGLGADDLALLACSLRDLDVRDGIIARLCPGALPAGALDAGLDAALDEALPVPVWSTLDGPEAGQVLDACLDRLIAVTRRLPDAEAPPLLCVVASLAWWQGDGTLTRAALERVFALDEKYRLARLLARMVDLAIRPPGRDRPARPGRPTARSRRRTKPPGWGGVSV